MARTHQLLKAYLLALAAGRTESTSRRFQRPTHAPVAFRARRIPPAHSVASRRNHRSGGKARGCGLSASQRPDHGRRDDDSRSSCAWELLRGGSGYYFDDDGGGDDNDDPSRRRPTYDAGSRTPPRRSAPPGQQYDRYGRAESSQYPDNDSSSSSSWNSNQNNYNEDNDDGSRDGYYAYDYEDEYERKRRNDPRRRRDASTQASDRGGPSLLSSVLPSVLQTGDKRIGLMMLGAGAAITMLGISLFFNKTLMRLGNLLVIAGVPVTLGPSRVAGYFVQPQKARATACLALGVFLVFVGWPVVGIALEVFGLLNLFGNLFPVVLALAKQMPVVGTVLNAGGSGGRRSSSQNKRDRYYEEEEDYYYDGQQKDQRPRDDDRYY